MTSEGHSRLLMPRRTARIGTALVLAVPLFVPLFVIFGRVHSLAKSPAQPFIHHGRRTAQLSFRLIP